MHAASSMPGAVGVVVGRDHDEHLDADLRADELRRRRLGHDAGAERSRSSSTAALIGRGRQLLSTLDSSHVARRRPGPAAVVQHDGVAVLDRRAAAGLDGRDLESPRGVGASGTVMPGVPSGAVTTVGMPSCGSWLTPSALPR